MNKIEYALELCENLINSPYVDDDDYADVLDIKEILESLR